MMADETVAFHGAISPRPFPSSQICLLLDSSFVLYFISLLFMVSPPPFAPFSFLDLSFYD